MEAAYGAGIALVVTAEHRWGARLTQLSCPVSHRVRWLVDDRRNTEMPHPKRAAIATVAALGLLLGACGGGSGGDASEPTTGADRSHGQVARSGRQVQLRPEGLHGQGGHGRTSRWSTKAKRTTTCWSQGVDKGKFKLSVTPGQTKTGAVTLAAGTYTIYCDIAGHRAAGMEAKLVVS